VVLSFFGYRNRIRLSEMSAKNISPVFGRCVYHGRFGFSDSIGEFVHLGFDVLQSIVAFLFPSVF
jgi:hypothetical protein